ncbi:MAG: hypothetical protein CBC38_03465 [Gammaproteobacteria bacterium TMED78]|nr:MAG: hypothetical protein CBC38_03465 [Gammaproteobacteria bacterium TMED78]|tara:strand:- start:2243 stop:3208 length:966 start_codon:yes stop_codon:yes gene_type:complete
MNKFTPLFIFFLILTPVMAHHSDAGYDFNSLIAFEGVVSSYVFRNPHVMIYVEDNANSDGPVEWEIETGSVPIMSRSGWISSLLNPGDIVTIRAHPERSGRNRAILSTLETKDGNLWSQIEGDLEATATAINLEGVWKGLSHTNIRRQFSDAAKLTPAAIKALEQYNDLTDDPNLLCIPHPTPFTIGSVNYLSGIEIYDDHVILRNEFLDVNRIVYMDGREHPKDEQRTFQGHSIGWYEGDSLVVDTRLFEKLNSGNGIGVPSGHNKHVVERYSLSDDRTRLIVDLFLEDPEFLEEPITATLEMLFTPHLKLYKYNCITEH